MSIANQIREIRGDRSQNQFASLIGVRKATVIEWEKGRSIPRDRNAHRLIALGLDPNAWRNAIIVAAGGEVA